MSDSAPAGRAIVKDEEDVMDLNVSGRNVTITERFQDYTADRLAKVEALAPKVQRVEVKVSRDAHARTASSQVTVEVTVLGSGPAIRAEARAADKFSAFDLTFAKLLERLRRARDRQKVHHGRHIPQKVHDATGALPVAGSAATLAEQVLEEQRERDAAGVLETPVEIRTKSFPALSMSVDDAVDNMELVGHPFYLFIDEATSRPSVVYRRKGWSYGVIQLNDAGPGDTPAVSGYRGAEPAPAE
ncbi:ribosome hibernation-promoting factor, HPF/YfiA family [Galactobacter valiniphilus]|uniref:ribosome hibernation-promoting factor, HPF/YfiA family n=1 Tax=Galactobacter valiniphilus TaxID=2676122 RepID=UPI0037352513